MCPANATFTIRECTFVFCLQSDLMAPLLMADKKCAREQVGAKPFAELARAHGKVPRSTFPQTMQICAAVHKILEFSLRWIKRQRVKYKPERRRRNEEKTSGKSLRRQVCSCGVRKKGFLLQTSKRAEGGEEEEKGGKEGGPY